MAINKFKIIGSKPVPVYQTETADRYGYGKFVNTLNDTECFIINKDVNSQFNPQLNPSNNQILSKPIFSPEPSTAKHVSEWKKIEALKQRELRLKHGIVVSNSVNKNIQKVIIL